MKIEDILYVMIGAIPGALLRYGVTSEAIIIEGLPVSVLIVNIVGSFILGVTMTGVTKLGFNAEFVPLIGVGFCGSLTTMSSFAYETVNLLDTAKLALLGLNIVLNVGLSIGAIIAGQAVINLISGLV
jgi:fluoride exporter